MTRREAFVAAFGAVITPVSVFTNLGGAWYGDPANVAQLALTLLYIFCWTALCALPCLLNAKIALAAALLTLLSGVVATLYKRTGLAFSASRASFFGPSPVSLLRPEVFHGLDGALRDVGGGRRGLVHFRVETTLRQPACTTFARKRRQPWIRFF